MFLLVIRKDGGLSASLAASPEATLQIPDHLRAMADEMQQHHGVRLGRH